MTTLPESATCTEDFLRLAGDLAACAREITTRHFRSALEVEQKPDLTPVTAADRAAEAAMRAMIAGAYPDHGILGEEYGAERADATYLWVLDPIDGTSRFTAGHPQYGTLIALLHRGTPILGMIDMPAMDERWLGAAGRPTLHSDHGDTKTAQTASCPDLAAASLFATSPHMFEGADHAAFERVRTAVRTPLFGGDCYAYGLLASGYVDLVIEADMDPYDYLSHVPIIEGAGGVITDWQGAPLRLDSDGRVLAAANPALHRAACARLAQS